MDNTKSLERYETDLMLGYTPEAALVRAKEAVDTVMKVINSRPNPLVINGKKYLEFEDWSLLALYFGITTHIDNVEEVNQIVDDRLKFIGFVATASALRDGKMVSNGNAECTRHEQNWMGKPRFQIREMACLRARRAALKTVLRWIFNFANVEPELEIDEDPDESEKLF